MNRYIKILFISCLAYIIPFYLFAQSSDWQILDTGLEIGEFEAPQKSIVGDSKITIIRINPDYYLFRLLSRDELNCGKLTAKVWCQKYNLIAIINAGMFLGDQQSNVGYMKNYNHINNGRINSKYFSVAAFNPIDSTNNSFKIFDIDESEMQEIIENYNAVIQNLRLIKHPALNRWSQQNRMWSEAALGQDKNKNVLFIFSRSPYSMHDLNNILINLPIDIENAQHLEGGPEASLYFSYKNVTIEKCGSYETGFNENDNNKEFWPIPNVIGLYKR